MAWKNPLSCFLSFLFPMMDCLYCHVLVSQEGRMNHLHQQEHEMVSKLGEKLLDFFPCSYSPQFFIIFAWPPWPKKILLVPREKNKSLVQQVIKNLQKECHSLKLT